MPGVQVPVSPGVLRWARETAGLAVIEVARVLKTDESSVRAWEQGTVKPNLGSARRLAEVYRRPLSAFLMPGPPEEAAAPADFRVGSAKGRLSREVRLAIRKSQRLQLAAADLFSALDVVPKWQRAVVDKDSDPESLADEVRSAVGIRVSEQAAWSDDAEAYRGWRGALGTTGVLVLQDSLPLEDLRGFSLTSDGPPTIVVNSRDSESSRIFTLFHELGHYLLGSGGICLPEPGGSAVLSHSEEDFCNRLAGAVLIPGSDFKKAFASYEQPGEAVSFPAGALRHLAARYRVSQQVVWYRLRTLKLITEAAFRERWILWSGPFPAPRKASGTPQIPAATRAISERGTTLVATILEAEHRQLLPLADAVDLLGVKTKDIPKLEERLARSRMRIAPL
jgi:Zn-dependent peptidase ImmA (M78 family)/transcriptional regulator with XRE-family HTH domain